MNQRTSFFLATALLISLTTYSQFSKEKSSYKKYSGLFDFYYDDTEDKIYLEIENLNQEFLYVNSLSSGIGSNDLGLDRGQLGRSQVVYFKKSGNKIMLIQPNLKFRAITENDLERKSVEQAFAKSILFGFKIEEENNGKFIIDITEFLMQDTHGVASKLKRNNQGSYSLSKVRSAIDLERTKAFPKNIEFDLILTFKGDAKGAYIRSVTPNAKYVTVSQHHSFIELPDSNFKKRVFDPRSGLNSFSYYDYATPVQESLIKRFISRHRLEKKNPNKAISEAVNPIIYYLDNGTPEPIRSALLEGGEWWNQAFEAIGYKNAFQLKVLPDDADPMDVRYNVIQWVHRSTRGWSYGSSVRDPRTGEILKGHVSLGSLRIRQDFMIAQALMNKPFADRDDNYQPMLDLALARIRQLSAHEIGHTLGFAHNFAASANGRASVMDYPHPQFSIVNGEIDFTNAYDNKIGVWDKVTVAYAYSDFADNINEKEALDDILEKAKDKGLQFISDSDARPVGGAHGFAHLWDNGGDIAEELENMLEIRKIAINNFSIENIKMGEPNSILEDVFVPLYFFHRYQTEATTKLIGGLNYNYAVRGDGLLVVATLDNKLQIKALSSVLKTLDASVLAIPKNKLHLFPPRAPGYRRSVETFKGKTGVAFDALAVAETSADMTLSYLLYYQRASRLIQQKSLESNKLGLKEVLDELVENTIYKSWKDAYLESVQEIINFRVVSHIMNLAAHTEVHPQVNAIAFQKLKEIRIKLSGSKTKENIVALEMVRRIDSFDPMNYKISNAAKIPNGSPIGMSCFH